MLAHAAALEAQQMAAGGGRGAAGAPRTAQGDRSARFAMVHTLIRKLINSTLFAGVGALARLVQAAALLYVLLGASMREQCDEATFLRMWLMGYTVRCLILVPASMLRVPPEQPEDTLRRIRQHGTAGRRRPWRPWSVAWHFRRTHAHQRVFASPPPSPPSSSSPTPSLDEDVERAQTPSRSSSGSLGEDDEAPLFTPRSDANANANASEPSDEELRAEIRERFEERIRLADYADKLCFRMDVYHTLWFVLGNVWVYGSADCATNAPWLFTACVAGLMFGFVGYIIPLLMTLVVCFCLPCAIVLLSSVVANTADLSGPNSASNPNRPGATDQEIEALPEEVFKPSTSGDGSGKLGSTVLDADDAVCPVCLDDFEDGHKVKMLPCGHAFHASCIDHWLKINRACPMCKQYAVRRPSDSSPTMTDA